MSTNLKNNVSSSLGSDLTAQYTFIFTISLSFLILACVFVLVTDYKIVTSKFILIKLITHVMVSYVTLQIILYLKFLLSPTIQKPDMCRNYNATSFDVALKPQIIFDGSNYKRWRAKTSLWLTTMNIYHVAGDRHEGMPSNSFEEKSLRSSITFLEVP